MTLPTDENDRTSASVDRVSGRQMIGVSWGLMKELLHTMESQWDPADLAELRKRAKIGAAFLGTLFLFSLLLRAVSGMAKNSFLVSAVGAIGRFSILFLVMIGLAVVGGVMYGRVRMMIDNGFLDDFNAFQDRVKERQIDSLWQVFASTIGVLLLPIAAKITGAIDQWTEGDRKPAGQQAIFRRPSVGGDNGLEESVKTFLKNFAVMIGLLILLVLFISLMVRVALGGF